MSKQIQIRRGSATEHENFTGAIGEITMDTTNKTLRVHDGETTGGIILAKESELESADYVIESQMPTEENGYTWYRKYKSGWLEQGGIYDAGSSKRDILKTITFIKPFKSAWSYSFKSIGINDTTTNPSSMQYGANGNKTTSINSFCFGFSTNDTARYQVWSAVGYGA